MAYRHPWTVCVLWPVFAMMLSTASDAQTIELTSQRLKPLGGAERERFLEAHNAARKSVGVDPIRWSDELAKVAAESLEQQRNALIEAAKEGWEEGRVALPTHRADTRYGENVAGWAGGKDRPAEFAVELWLREKASFEKLNAVAPYRTGDEQGQTEVGDSGRERPIAVGHYTAVVWRATEQIGAAQFEFALTDGKTTRTYVAIVCNYNPPGNRLGEKPF
jgi:hypothetical protein